MKVIYTPTKLSDPYKEGVSDMKRIDDDYVTVNGHLYHAAFVFLDTLKNRRLLDDYAKEYKAWVELEPNAYTVLNAMDKPND